MVGSLQRYACEFINLARRPRSLFSHALGLAHIAFSALMLWKGLIMATGSTLPAVVYLSGGDPWSGFHRGDVLFLAAPERDSFEAGDVVVFQVRGRDIPIVHRIMNVHEQADGAVAILTKGDGNVVDDRGLYAHQQLFLGQQEIVGRVWAFLPYIGMVAIWLDDFPEVRCVLVVSIGFLLLLGRGSRGECWLWALICAVTCPGTVR